MTLVRPVGKYPVGTLALIIEAYADGESYELDFYDLEMPLTATYRDFVATKKGARRSLPD